MIHSELPEEIPARFVDRLTGKGKAVLAVLLAVGVGAFLTTLAGDPDRAWRAYLANWLFFTSVAQGAVILAVATTITRAEWAWSVRRIAAAFAAFLPVSFLLLLPLLFVAHDLFPWVEEMAHDPVLQRKAAYLNIPFLWARNLGGLALLFGMSLYFVYRAVRPDLKLAAGDGGEAGWRKGLWGRLTGEWRGQEAEEVRSHRVLGRLAPATALVYAVVFSFVSFDWIMSMEPHWFSTLLGGWFFMGAFWGGIAATAVAALWIRRRDDVVAGLVGPQQRHDLGKLAFAFTVFWAYLFWSQYIVIWYGKLPWEQAFVITRSQEPWATLALTVVFLCFIIPFAGLLGKRPKIEPGWLGLFSVIILAGLWCERLLLVAPPLHHGEGPAINGMEVLIGLGFLALLVGSVRWFLARFPVVQLWQPLVEAEDVVGGERPATADEVEARE